MLFRSSSEDNKGGLLGDAPRELQKVCCPRGCVSHGNDHLFLVKAFVPTKLFRALLAEKNSHPLTPLFSHRVPMTLSEERARTTCSEMAWRPTCDEDHIFVQYDIRRNRFFSAIRPVGFVKPHLAA